MLAALRTRSVLVGRVGRDRIEEVRDSTKKRGLQAAFELFELAEEMMVQNIRRRFPGADEVEVEERLRCWLKKKRWDLARGELPSTVAEEPGSYDE